MDALTLLWLAPVLLPFALMFAVLGLGLWSLRPKEPLIARDEAAALDEMISFLEAVAGDQKWEISVDACRRHAEVLGRMRERLMRGGTK